MGCVIAEKGAEWTQTVYHRLGVERPYSTHCCGLCKGGVTAPPSQKAYEVPWEVSVKYIRAILGTMDSYVSIWFFKKLLCVCHWSAARPCRSQSNLHFTWKLVCFWREVDPVRLEVDVPGSDQAYPTPGNTMPRVFFLLLRIDPEETGLIMANQMQWHSARLESPSVTSSHSGGEDGTHVRVPRSGYEP